MALLPRGFCPGASGRQCWRLDCQIQDHILKSSALPSSTAVMNRTVPRDRSQIVRLRTGIGMLLYSPLATLGPHPGPACELNDCSRLLSGLRRLGCGLGNASRHGQPLLRVAVEDVLPTPNCTARDVVLGSGHLPKDGRDGLGQGSRPTASTTGRNAAER